MAAGFIAFSLFFGILGFAALWPEQSLVALAFVETFFGLIFLAGVYMLWEYLIHRLTVYADGTLAYRGYFGRTSSFFLYEIARAEVKMLLGTPTLFLFDMRGKRLARIENNMRNYAELKKWLSEKGRTIEKVKVSSKIDEKIKGMNGVLEIKGGRIFLFMDIFFLSMFLPLGVAMAAYLFLAPEISQKEIAAVLIFLFVILGSLLFGFIKHLRTCRNLRLVLTTGRCWYMDRKGNTEEFLFEEIKTAREVTGYKGAVSIEIRGRQGQLLVYIPPDFAVIKKKYICPFIKYHQNQIWGGNVNDR